MGNSTPIYKDHNKSFEERASDLVSRMTLKEKVLQMTYKAPEIKRLGIPAYDWWNECLHGVARAGIATVFPQAIGLGATFNPELIFNMAEIISDEARAKHHEFVRKNDRGRYKGLTFWSPNVNIFRDPRWGRGQETYGEDPYLTGRLGVAFTKALQGDDPKYLKLVATPKHYAVHSGPEKDRHRFNAIASPKDLRETYLPHFKECVQEAKAESVMGAYNRTNDEPCCGSPTLLQKILRDEWGFAGYIVSDCGAIRDFHAHHKITKNAAESSAMAVKNGCDLNCGIAFRRLRRAVKKKLISEKEIDVAVTRLMLARLKLGMFDPPEVVKYAQIPYEVNDCEKHRNYARKVAQESIVMLKNEDNALPLSSEVKKIAVIGPNGDNLDSLLGNYNGKPSKYVTPLQGIINKIKENNSPTTVVFEKGCSILKGSAEGIEKATQLAKDSDIAILVMGISPKIEGEQGLRGFGDRTSLDLPEIQQKLMKSVVKIGVKTILVILNGSPMTIDWADENVPAILEAWYPGEEGGNALADIIFGDVSPGGRLPLTFVKSIEDLPEFTDYNMKGRTYRYIEKEPLYPFGFGLSYTKFEYSSLKLSKSELNIGDSLEVSVNVKNSGDFDADEVVQLYLKDLESSVPIPHHELRGIKRLHLKIGESQEIKFEITPRMMALIDEKGKCIIEPGEFKIFIGGSQPDEKSQKLTNHSCIEQDFVLTGEKTTIPY